MESPILCPKCGNDNLHHGEVQVWNRQGEDKAGKKTIVFPDGGQNTLAVEADRGFAGRRSDVRMKFNCEQCPMTSWLYIIQHKGSTLLRWAEDDNGGIV